MKHPVRTYEPKPTKIQALKFAATEAGINAARKFCGSNFATQMVGKHSLRFLLRTTNGWVPVNDGDYICQNDVDFYPNRKDTFEARWKPVKSSDDD